MQIYVPPVVQGPPADPALRSPRADSEGAAPTTAAGPTALAPAGPSVSAVSPVAASGSAPAPPPQPPPVFLRRPAPLCSDFGPAPGGAGWSALASVQFPGPRGPVQVTFGQVVVPGDYVDGLDLGSMLQRDCPRTASTPP